MSEAPAEQRTIALVREYADLLAACRARMAELDITFDILDHRSGVQAGYSAKLIGPTPCKRFGDMSLGCIMGALGISLLVVEDPHAMRNYRLRQERRRMPRRMPPAGGINLGSRIVSALQARRMNDLRREKVPPERRQLIARQAARARWRRAANSTAAKVRSAAG